MFFFIGIIASFIGSMVGGGGLLTIPFLIFLGLPPEVAIATNKFGGIGMAVGALTEYTKEKKVRWKYVLPLSVIGLFGALIGANILISINKAVLSKAVGFIILLILPTIFLERNAGLKRTNTSKHRKTTGYLLYFLGMVWGAFFGGGGGILVFYILISFFGFTIIDSSATNKIPWLLLGIVASIIFAINGLINFYYGFTMMAGMLIGGYIGATTAVIKGNKWVKYVFAVVVLASALKLIFF